MLSSGLKSIGRSLSAARVAVACVLALDVFVGALAVRSAQQSYEFFSDRAATSSRNQAQTFAQNLGTVLDQIDKTLAVLVAEEERKQADGGIELPLAPTFLANQRERLPDAFGLGISDADGRIRQTVDDGRAPGSSIAQAEWFDRLRRGTVSDLVISQPQQAAASQRWYVALGRSYRTAAGQFAGVVFALVDTSYFLDLFSRVDLGPGGSAILCGADTRLIARYPARADLATRIGAPPPTDAFGDAIRKAPNGGVYHPTVTIDGVDRIQAYQKISPYPLYVLVGTASDHILAEWHKQTGQLAAAVGGFVLVTLFFSAAILSIWNRKGRTQKMTDAILANSPVGIAIIGADRIIRRVNRKYCAIYGIEAQELLGQSATILYESAQQADDIGQRAYPCILAGGRFEDEIPMRRKDGESLWIRLNGSLVDPLDPTNGVVWVIEDISLRKAAEERIQRLTNLYAALSQCNQAIVRAKSEEELFPLICRDTVRYGGMKMAWIGLVAPDSCRISIVAAAGDNLPSLEDLNLSTNERTPFGQSVSARAIRDDKPFWCQDFLRDPAATPWHDQGRKAGWNSVASLPLHRKGIPVGCLTLYSDIIEAFDEDVRSLLCEMAIDISFALDNFARETERRQAAEDLRVAATAFDCQEGMVFTDHRRTITQANRAFAEMTGYAAPEAIGQTLAMLRSDRHDDVFYEQIWESVNRDGGWRGEVWIRRKDGVVSPSWVTAAGVTTESRDISHYVVTFSDIGQLKASEEQIKHLAYYDPLTGLPNRRLLLDRLQQALAASARSKRDGALLLIDLDNFKILNDTINHETGDLLLQRVAQRIAGCLRAGDTVARLGGDEFVVLLEDLSDGMETAAILAENVAEKILRALATSHRLAEQDLFCTASIGLVLFADHRGNLEDVLKQADLAMYQAKAAGRNTWRFFDPDMQATASARASLEQDLRAAIRQQAFSLAYQPQVNADGRVTGAEVLLRWQHPERGLISPDTFIPVAEETGLILPLGQWVLQSACRQLALWEAQADTARLSLAVNVSVRQFHQPDFVSQVLATLAESHANPRKLKLELTESLVVDDIDTIIDKMSALKARGVTFSLDDFGTGYSSLSCLKRLPLSQLKIDRTFIRDVLTDPNDAALVRTIIALTESMGLDVIAEGVETEEQRAFLEQVRCLAYQGYLYGRPMPVDAFQTLLR